MRPFQENVFCWAVAGRAQPKCSLSGCCPATPRRHMGHCCPLPPVLCRSTRALAPALSLSFVTDCSTQRAEIMWVLTDTSYQATWDFCKILTWSLEMHSKPLYTPLVIITQCKSFLSSWRTKVCTRIWKIFKRCQRDSLLKAEGVLEAGSSWYLVFLRLLLQSLLCVLSLLL